MPAKTLHYLRRLDDKSGQVVQLVDSLPMHPSLRSELTNSWRLTREKLAYFYNELEQADGDLRLELAMLHKTLLPDLIHYQVRAGAKLINASCDNNLTYLHRYNSIWENATL